MARPVRLAASVASYGATLDEVVASSERRLGLPIKVRRGDDLDGPTAVVTLVPERLALIQVDQGVDDERLAHVVGHELGHLLLGHGSGQRRHFDDGRERDAELFGTEIARRMRRPRLSERSRAVR